MLGWYHCGRPQQSTPTQSPCTGVAGAILRMLLNRGFAMRAMHLVIESTVLMTTMVFFIAVAATTFSYVIRSLWIAVLLAINLKP